MQLVKVNRDYVLKPLRIVRGVVENRHTQPILANVLIEKNNDEISFLASDLEIQINTRSHITTSEGEVATTVSVRKLFDLLNSLDAADEVSLSIEDETLVVRSGRSRFVLQTLPAQDYPKISIPQEWDLEVELTQEQLKKMFSMTSFSMANQDVRYFLNGMLFVFEQNMMRTVSTDGHRLAHAAQEIAGLDANSEVIVPRKTIIELQKLLDESEAPVRISVCSTQIRFRFGDVDLVSKLVEGKFPDYKRVIPAPYQSNIVLNRQELQSAFQRVCILTDDKIKGVKCLFTKGLLCITSVNKDREQAREEIEIDYDKTNLELAFNASYLLDVLSMSSKTEEVIWSVNPDQALAPSLITLPNESQFKYVVMPMRI